MGNTVLFTPGNEKPAKLFILDKTGTIREEMLGASTKIGRYYAGSDADIKLNSAIVSRQHGEFLRLPDGYCYKDLGSLNGTFVNGVKYGKESSVRANVCRLSDGDVLRVDQKNLEKMHPEAVLMIFSTHYDQNEWKEMRLDRAQGNIKIGRNTASQEGVKIADKMVSKDHASFLCGLRGWSIIDHNSTNGVYLNNERITQPRELHNLDVIRIINTTFIFMGDRLIYNSRESGYNQLVIQIEERSVKQLFKKHVLLQNINLTIDPGDMVLILGGSGAGKTTFLNAVMGYEKAQQGKIKHGDIDLYKDYSKMKYQIGFVPQQDLMREDDVVYDTLENAAAMKMAKSSTKEERARRIDEVLELLGLQREKNSLVKKLSGGQKKRLSIAIEYIANPSLFFLDEPDSGLDGIMARSLMENLRVIADEGKIVMVITHAPDRVSDLFDKVIVLAKSAVTNSGHLAFYGSIDQAKEFFETDSLEGVVRRINRKDEGGDGMSDVYIEKYKNYSKEV